MTAELYRHFDRSGALLYVGISLSVVQRLRSHSATSRWFQEIDYITVERFQTRTAARKAEREAIYAEHPCYNVEGATSFSLTNRLRRDQPDNADIQRICDAHDEMLRESDEPIVVGGFDRKAYMRQYMKERRARERAERERTR